ncbi:hypothetical protein [Vibrio alginolyticus]|uniref:hypothetical protein n=1 Tax=Vibrio alginolyticus TaxID=663 RepID=UPI001BD268D8|nr:hypothetical protein [Vibrio alginolyticus]MBS9937587.1 hypothetical protein [Vibrio alginolyticus]
MSSENDDLKVALDYREQLQQKSYSAVVIDDKILRGLKEHLDLVFPNTEEKDQFAIDAIRKLIIEAHGQGYQLSAVELKEFLTRVELDKENPLLGFVPTVETTDYDDFATGVFSQVYSKSITQACNELGFNIRSGFSIGVVDRGGLQAEQVPVWMTNASVISISTDMLIISNRLSKLLAKSMAFDLIEGENYRLSTDINKYKKKLLDDTELQHEWSMFFADCGYNPQRPSQGERVSLQNEYDQSCFIDFSDSILNFVLGHECGHHIAQHSLGGIAGADRLDDSDQYRDEKEADMLGCHIAMHMGHNPNEPNWFSAINLGATCILKATDLIQRSHNILKSGNQSIDFQVNSAHPPLADRLELVEWFVGFYYENGPEKNVALSMHRLIIELFEFVWGNVSIFIQDIHDQGYRPEPQNTQWLPDL